jgi:hypothetical protein
VINERQSISRVHRQIPGRSFRKQEIVDQRHTPPKPQPGGRRTLAALLVTRFARSCGACVAYGVLPAAPLSPAPHRTATAPHASPASSGAPSGSLRSPSLRPPPSRVLLAAVASLRPLVGTRRRPAVGYL